MSKLSLLTVGAITMFQAMFLYSGSMKILNFDKKIQTLIKKLQEQFSLNLHQYLATAGMIGVVALEIIGSLCLIAYSIYRMKHEPSDKLKSFVTGLIVMFVLFVAVVTVIYHPLSDKKIPFLSNLTTLSGFILMHSVIQ